MARINKVALVTGGARRLGKEISIELAKSGYDIILNYNKTKKTELEETIWEIEAEKVNVTPILCDVSKVSEIKKMFKVIHSKYKTLDLLVNNAAIFSRTDFLETDEKTYDSFMNTNLKGVFFCCQEAAKIMLEGTGDCYKIINIASLGGIENWTGYIPYSLSKTGVIKLSRQLAKRLAPKILVNAIAPGTVIIDHDGNENVNYEDIKKYPMKRFALPGDLTSVINYLANDNRYITGQTFVVDGGRSL